MKRFVYLALLIVGLGGSIAFRTATAQKAELTFNRDVAPIIFNRCTNCHRPGEIAPMSFQNYKEVRPWAKSIREKVVSREMPPWHADPHIGAWENDKRLSQKEIDTITAWVDSGAKEGLSSDLPPLPRFSSGWQIGQPDVVFQMPEEFNVPAQGSVPYKYYIVPSGFKEDTWVTAMEARAGNLSVVHHIVIYVREPGQMQGKKPGDLGDGLLGALSPGMTPFVAQPGTAKLIKAGSNIVFQMHYTPNGTESRDRSQVGLRISKSPVSKVITTTAAWDGRFVIPPNDPNYEVKASWLADEDIEIISFMPHMHLRGKDYIYRAVYPDGKTETLLSVPRYDFSWQVYYYPKVPIKIAKGTRIETIAHYDNSVRNHQNPDPSKPVRFGEQTWEEMMNGFFDYIPVTKSATKSAE